MNPGLSFDTLDRFPSLNKHQFHELLTGKEIQYTCSTQVCPYSHNVRPDNMNQVIEAVKRLEKFYPDGRYSSHIGVIKKAYGEGDFETFHQEIGELFVTFGFE